MIHSWPWCFCNGFRTPVLGTHGWRLCRAGIRKPSQLRTCSVTVFGVAEQADSMSAKEFHVSNGSLGLWVVAPLKAGQRGAPMMAFRHQRSPIMTTKRIDKSAKSDLSAVTRRAAGRKAPIAPDQAPTTTTGRKREALHPEQHPVEGRVTKHVKLLQLLNRPEGASIDEMMQATEWQQHSVRGFLAGTVKKKRGLALTSAKAEGEVRRYRIATRRGRWHGQASPRYRCGDHPAREPRDRSSARGMAASSSDVAAEATEPGYPVARCCVQVPSERIRRLVESYSPQVADLGTR